MCDFQINDLCFFLNDEFEHSRGTVMSRINWRGDALIVIEGDDREHYVRPAALVASDPDAAIGFARHDDALMTQIADLVMVQRHA